MHILSILSQKSGFSAYLLQFVSVIDSKPGNLYTQQIMISLNEYFNGNVKSLSVNNNEGRSTVGVIDKGQYEFGTATIEIMHIVSGKLDALLPGETEWKTFSKGSSFRIEKGLKFSVRTEQETAYLCEYK